MEIPEENVGISEPTPEELAATEFNNKVSEIRGVNSQIRTVLANIDVLSKEHGDCNRLERSGKVNKAVDYDSKLKEELNSYKSDLNTLINSYPTL